MDYIIGIFAVLGGIILVLIKKVGGLQSDKKLADIKVKDAALKQSQKQVEQTKVELKEELKKIEEHKAEDLSDTEIEKYWEKHK